jgi:hypothetical protein
MSLIAALALLGMSAQEPAAQAVPKGLADASKLKADFNAAKGRVRLLFIFSPS